MTASSGTKHFNLEQRTDEQLNQGLQATNTMLDSDRRSYSQAQRTNFGDNMDVVACLAERQIAGEKLDFSKYGESGKSMQQAVNDTVRYSEGKSQSVNKAAELKIGATASTPKLFGIGGSFDTNYGVTEAGSKTHGSDYVATLDKQSSESYSNIAKTMASEEFARDFNIDKNLAERCSQSYSKEQAAEQQLAKTMDKSNQYHNAISHNQSRGGSSSKDMYHVVEQEVAKTYGVSQKTAHDMIENGDARVDRVWNNMVAQNTNNLLSKINTGKENLSQESSTNQLDDFSRSSENKLNQANAANMQDVTQEALNKGVNRDTIASKVESTERHLQGKNQEIMNMTENQIQQTKAENTKGADDIQQTVNKKVDEGNNVKKLLSRLKKTNKS